MNNPVSIAIAAANFPDWSPPAELAKAVTIVRGMPNPYHTVFMCGVQLTSWQAIIAEAMIMEQLAQAVAL